MLLFLQLESPRVLVVSVWGGQSILHALGASLVKTWDFYC